jgi:hypothetical protein
MNGGLSGRISGPTKIGGPGFCSAVMVIGDAKILVMLDLPLLYSILNHNFTSSGQIT